MRGPQEPQVTAKWPQLASAVITAVCRFAMDVGPLDTSDARSASNDYRERSLVTDGEAVALKCGLFLLIYVDNLLSQKAL